MAKIGKIDVFPMEVSMRDMRISNAIQWKISNFSSLSGENSNFYVSPSFNFYGESWYLRLYPNGRQLIKSVGCIGLYLMRETSLSAINIEYTLGLKRLNGKKYLEHFRTNVYKDKGEGYGVHNCIFRSEVFDRKSDLLPADVLTVFCNLQFPTTIQTSSKYYIHSYLHN